ncbi:glycerophosphoryl diester phosphodiesterase [Alcanivorax xiamenensis]|uniref:glycerophosphodiester phosphodiesterase n=1 Tax=Alcanivorax xiamenensis TaxID=1177156 RepID=A0ABQ6Y4P1_9GAMM|nr:glycerophosphodiester phosphodiesterase family protein [Alcanivorax xiamenensis]KAF0804193.1 glycerophosphoryl diester phosphodiesterase [Alcanivorax xiamenensis]
MRSTVTRSMLALSLLGLATAACANNGKGNGYGHGADHGPDRHRPVHIAGTVELGPRPYYLVDDMDPGPLKRRLQSCAERKRPQRSTDWSIGHRGAPLQFPEHTEESYRAAARMGAGILECDVAFTRDKELVCRHSQCDLHTTTNILATDLAGKCSSPPVPLGNGEYDFSNVSCCTSDLTLEEFKSLEGKMDAGNPDARTVEEYMASTPDWRTDLYSQNGTLMSHKESIALFQELGVKMTPELKEPSVPMPYDGDYTQERYAQQLINEYKEAGVSPRQVLPQSFNLDDVLYWISAEPAYGRQAVYLDDRDGSGLDPQNPGTWEPDMATLAGQGVNYLAPPLWMLVTTDANNQIVPSEYARAAKAAGLQLIAWSLERSGPLASGGGWYYQSVNEAIDNDGDTLTLLDVLARDVGVTAVFSDWPATTTFYANCMGL